MFEKIPSEIIESMDSIRTYASGTNDWLRIKKEIIRSIRPELRTLFSTRDPVTKKQKINDFDKLIALYWQSITGVSLIITQDGKESKVA